MEDENNQIKAMEYLCNGKTLTFIKPQIMAIVNVTPDSFYDGGKYSETKDILNDVEEKINQGATIIDIGAVSTRPNAKAITVEEEWKRIENPLREIRKHFPDIFLSVDTYHSNIAKRSAEEGVDIINDVSGGNMDKEMLDTVSKINLPYILTHLDGRPETMGQNEEYENVVETVKKSFQEKIEILQKKNFTKIILDPGFGFGKSLRNNYVLLKYLETLNALGFPLLAGISRKSMINKVIGTNPVTALNGTTVLNTIALLNGAKILRVHDVMEAKQVIELVEFYADLGEGI